MISQARLDLDEEVAYTASSGSRFSCKLTSPLDASNPLQVPPSSRSTASSPRDPNDAVVVRNGVFTWDKAALLAAPLSARPTLSGLSFRVQKGELVAVVGTVGSGKSSLISAVLGRTRRLETS